jgi:hypothetical protein
MVDAFLHKNESSVEKKTHITQTLFPLLLKLAQKSRSQWYPCQRGKQYCLRIVLLRARVEAECSVWWMEAPIPAVSEQLMA